MTEGNLKQNITSRIYKYKVKNNRLIELNHKDMIFKNFKGIQGHNLYITPDLKYLYAPLGARVKKKNINPWAGYVCNWLSKNEDYRYYKDLYNRFDCQEYFNPQLYTGAVYVVNSNNLKIKTMINAGKGAGHVAFSKQKQIAIVTNHLDNFVTAINYKKHKFIKNIYLPFERENIFNLTQSHMQYVSKDGNYYYNFWSDGGVFFRINLNELDVDSSIYVGGIPIQGNFYEKVAINCNLPKPSADDGYDKFFGYCCKIPVQESIKIITNTKKYIEKNSLENIKYIDGYIDATTKARRRFLKRIQKAKINKNFYKFINN